MGIKEWLNNKREQKVDAHSQQSPIIDDEISKLWTKCFNCGANLPKMELEQNMSVCPKCNYHFRINALTRLEQIVDEGSFTELDKELGGGDPLSFSDSKPYKKRYKEAKEKTGLNEAIITGVGEICSNKVCIGIMDFAFMGGSMGSAIGEKVTRLIEKAIKSKLPVVIFTSSGGARMQESVLSLMQMAKTSAAVQKLAEAKLLYITVLTEPTFGGVTASFATLGDIIIAEEGARIGFAGKRVIEQTIKQNLPPDFQTAEYLLKHGQVDMICSRQELKKRLAFLIEAHSR